MDVWVLALGGLGCVYVIFRVLVGFLAYDNILYHGCFIRASSVGVCTTSGLEVPVPPPVFTLIKVSRFMSSIGMWKESRELSVGVDCVIVLCSEGVLYSSRVVVIYVL